MGMLKHMDSGRVEPVPGHLLIGRGPSASLRLDDKTVSGEHATLQWRKGHWELRDLGSRNGTFVDGQRMVVGQPKVLRRGNIVAFGTDDSRWMLADDGAPSALAVTADGAVKLADSGLLALPDQDDPQLVIYADARGNWVQEAGDEVKPVVDGTTVMLGHDTWTIRIPRTVEGTATVDIGPTLETIRLAFRVSRDEEHVALVVKYRGQETVMEAREHFYALLTLARARIADKDDELSEQGWVDRNQLLKMLGTDGNGLNVAIYRVRGQLTKLGVEGAAGIVEVRRGQRRFGIEAERVTIEPM